MLPAFLPWVRLNLGVDTTAEDKEQEDMEVDPPVINLPFLEELGTDCISRRSFLKWERIMHSHGCTF